MPKARDPRLEQFWRKTVAGWNKSGLSVRAYCARHHLRDANFYAWRRERKRPLVGRGLEALRRASGKPTSHQWTLTN